MQARSFILSFSTKTLILIRMHSYFLVRVCWKLHHLHTQFLRDRIGACPLQEAKLEHGAAPQGWWGCAHSGVSTSLLLGLMVEDSGPGVWGHCWYRREYLGRVLLPKRDRGGMTVTEREREVHTGRGSQKCWSKQKAELGNTAGCWGKGGSGSLGRKFWLSRLHVLCQGRSWLGGEELGRGKGWAGNHHCSWGEARGMGTGGGRGHQGCPSWWGQVILGAPAIRPREASYACVSLSATSWSCQPGEQNLLRDKEEAELQKTNPEQKDSIDR